MKLEDVPTFKHFPARQNKDRWCIRYAEGLNIGYRAKKYRPRYPFGFGLSYTQFLYNGLQLSFDKKSGRDLEVLFFLSNVGKVDAFEVVQVYISEVKPVVPRPKKELKAFRKIWVKADARSLPIRISIDRRTAFSWWDDRTKGLEGWRANPGEYEVRVGGMCGSIDLKEGFGWQGL